MNINVCLKELSEAEGVSGAEDAAARTALEYLKKYTADCFIKNGNVIANFGSRSNEALHVLIDAHIDQVGLIVTYVGEDGFLNVGNVGGIDRRLLPGQHVIIHGRKDVTGTICSVPPHLSGGKKGEVPQIDKFTIDTGLSQQKASEIIAPGDRISFDIKYREMLGGRVTCKALDDRSGAASIIYALELLKNEKIKCSYTVLFSTQEELGERGAKIAAYDIDPDIALAVDVSFGYTDGESEYECGKLGKGPMIGISPSLSGEISRSLISIAEKCGIPYQTEVMNGLTSTNADQFSVNRCGCKVCTVSIPLRYMHTPVEVIDIQDVKNTGKLIAEYIKEAY